MAGIAAFLIGCMQDITDQGRPVAAVRIVTGKATAQGAWIASMLRLHLLCLMTGSAQFIRRHGQEHGPV